MSLTNISNTTYSFDVPPHCSFRVSFVSLIFSVRPVKVCRRGIKNLRP